MALPSLNELSPYYNKKDLIDQVILQLKKDFNWADLTIVFKESSTTLYQQLFNTILPIIDTLIHEDYEKLTRLLYHIDIDENLIQKQLKAFPHADTHEILTDLILKRELQKIIIKAHYSGSNL